MRFHHLIPPLGVPYSIGDFIAGAKASFRQGPSSPDPLKELFGERPLFWTGSGRQALSLILSALKLPRGAGIAVPLFGSTSVTETISSMGFEPVFIDVHKSTLTVDPAEVERVRHRAAAIVVQHLFGHLADMTQILKAASGIPVIEDTAQAPLSFLNGRMAGTFGVASFYSFASSKYLPAAGGGLAAINSPELALEFSRQVDKLMPPSPLAEFRRGVMQAVKAGLFRRPLYALAGNLARSSTKPRSLFTANLDLQAIARGSAAVVLRQAPVFPTRVQEQQSIACFCSSSSQGFEALNCPTNPVGPTITVRCFLCCSAIVESAMPFERACANGALIPRTYIRTHRSVRGRWGIRAGVRSRNRSPQHCLCFPIKPVSRVAISNLWPHHFAHRSKHIARWPEFRPVIPKPLVVHRKHSWI
jgi:hypothetical protein